MPTPNCALGRQSASNGIPGRARQRRPQRQLEGRCGDASSENSGGAATATARKMENGNSDWRQGRGEHPAAGRQYKTTSRQAPAPRAAKAEVRPELSRQRPGTRSPRPSARRDWSNAIGAAGQVRRSAPERRTEVSAERPLFQFYGADGQAFGTDPAPPQGVFANSGASNPRLGE